MVFLDEFLFYTGVAAFGGSILCFILFCFAFHIKTIKLKEQLEREYGRKIGKDGHLAETEKKKEDTE